MTVYLWKLIIYLFSTVIWNVTVFHNNLLAAIPVVDDVVYFSNVCTVFHFINKLNVVSSLVVNHLHRHKYFLTTLYACKRTVVRALH